MRSEPAHGDHPHRRKVRAGGEPAIGRLRRVSRFLLPVGDQGLRALARGRAPQKPVIALSGRRQEIAFLDRDDAGAVVPRLRTFDFDLDNEVDKPLLGTHGLVDPVAMTYRAEDDAYYILDRTLDTPAMAVLYRLPRGNTLEVLGTWHREGKLTETAMTTGTDGTLVISSWNAKEHAVAVLDVDALSHDRGKHAGRPADRARLDVLAILTGKERSTSPPTGTSRGSRSSSANRRARRSRSGSSRRKRSRRASLAWISPSTTSRPVWVDDDDVLIETAPDTEGDEDLDPTGVLRVSRATPGAPTMPSGL